MPPPVEFETYRARRGEPRANVVAAYRSLYLGGGGVVRGSRLVIRQSSADTPTCSPAGRLEGEPFR
jgi:hypothetical protein